MTNDENVPYVPYETLSKVIALDHFRDFQEIRDLQAEFRAQAEADKKVNESITKAENNTTEDGQDEQSNSSYGTLPWERDLSDLGISFDSTADNIQDSLTGDPIYDFWTSQFTNDQKLRELYIRPKLSPIFFDDELDKINSRLEAKLNMWDYLQRKIHYYRKLMNQK